mgnify:CR=1 FL=1
MKVIFKSRTHISFEYAKRETEIIGKLIHPNIVRDFNSFEDENDFSFIIEYIDGGILEQLLDKRRLDEQQMSKCWSRC